MTGPAPRLPLVITPASCGVGRGAAAGWGALFAAHLLGQGIPVRGLRAGPDFREHAHLSYRAAAALGPGLTPPRGDRSPDRR